VSYAPIKTKLDRHETVILDGGTGTELERLGAKMSPEAWCGPATLENQDLLLSIHLNYLAAGADVITANTYASSRLMLESAGFGDQVHTINQVALQVAHKARAERGDAEFAIAGSMSHMVPIALGRDQADVSRNPSEAQVAEAFHELATIHAENGADLIILEMMYHPVRMPLALAAATATGLPVWVGMSARRSPTGEMLSFMTEDDMPFSEVVAIMADFDIDAAGVMHTQSNLIADAIDLVSEQYTGPLMAYPDSGYFAMPEWQFEDIIPPAELKDYARNWQHDHNVSIIGGCCGLSPAHIEGLASLR